MLITQHTLSQTHLETSALMLFNCTCLITLEQVESCTLYNIQISHWNVGFNNSSFCQRTAKARSWLPKASVFKQIVAFGYQWEDWVWNDGVNKPRSSGTRHNMFLCLLKFSLYIWFWIENYISCKWTLIEEMRKPASINKSIYRYLRVGLR